MAKQQDQTKPRRTKLSANESLKRVQAFAQRKKQFLARIRKNKNRSLLA